MKKYYNKLFENYEDRIDNLLWMQDEGPYHRTPNVRDMLREVFGNRIIGVGLFDTAWFLIMGPS